MGQPGVDQLIPEQDAANADGPAPVKTARDKAHNQTVKIILRFSSFMAGPPWRLPVVFPCTHVKTKTAFLKKRKPWIFIFKARMLLYVELILENESDSDQEKTFMVRIKIQPWASKS